jgi:pyruvate/2-oxoglutarate dehydrogenase complex dihydrolipoamide dehydrogenase (E3) component
MKTFDVVVIGGGTAGTAAAQAAHAAGASTVMFNDGELGGLCILRGCMPTKTMLHSAHVVHGARHHGARGIGAAELPVAFAEVMANKDAKVARFVRAKIASIEAGGYEVVDARARFVGPDTVEAGGETYRFVKGAVLAAGSISNVPPIPGIEDVPVWSSDDLIRITERPESLIVIGSGAIGIEFAQFFARIGTSVELVSRRQVFCDVDPLIAVRTSMASASTRPASRPTASRSWPAPTCARRIRGSSSPGTRPGASCCCTSRTGRAARPDSARPRRRASIGSNSDWTCRSCSSNPRSRRSA